MADKPESPKKQNINFNLDPGKVPVLYADSYLIGSNDHVVTLNFAQALPEPSQQQIVARVALTRKQAKAFLASLDDHTQKFEI
jgi:hypothetical protein